MTTKEMSRQLRILDTRYGAVKKLVSELNMEQEAVDGITDILDAQSVVHRKQIVEGVALFPPKVDDDVTELKIAKSGGL